MHSPKYSNYSNPQSISTLHPTKSPKSTRYCLNSTKMKLITIKPQVQEIYHKIIGESKKQQKNIFYSGDNHTISHYYLDTSCLNNTSFMNESYIDGQPTTKSNKRNYKVSDLSPINNKQSRLQNINKLQSKKLQAKSVYNLRRHKSDLGLNRKVKNICTESTLPLQQPLQKINSNLSYHQTYQLSINNAQQSYRNSLDPREYPSSCSNISQSRISSSSDIYTSNYERQLAKLRAEEREYLIHEIEQRLQMKRNFKRK